MKNIISVILTLLVSASVFAQTSKALIYKNSGGGYTMPEWVHYETCEVYLDKVVITHTYGTKESGGINVVEEKPLQIDAQLLKVIDKADAENVTLTPNNMCDGPSTEIKAKLPNGSWTILFETGGCGNSKKEKTGTYSRHLIEVVGQFCPTTIGGSR